MLKTPGVQVVALVPSAGPVPPPIMLQMPPLIASWYCCGDIICMCVSKCPGVHIVCSPAVASVQAEITRLEGTLSIVYGLPALPTPAIFPSFIPISPLTTPSTGSRTTAFVITKSRAPFELVTPGVCANPSLIVFPPPKTTSSPGCIRSFSTSIIRSVSPSLILSPTVAPNRSVYCFRVSLRTISILLLFPMLPCSQVSWPSQPQRSLLFYYSYYPLLRN